MAYARLTYEEIVPSSLHDQVHRREYGGYVVFEGRTRSVDASKEVLMLEYSAYMPLAEKELYRIATDVESRWAASCAIVHRLGKIAVGEISVAVAVGGRHRAEAFEACRWAIDTLKSDVPIWKKETLNDGAVWIEGDAHVPSQTTL